MRLVGYARVSTDDKGQNPERQVDVFKTFCARNGGELLATVKDEGTSGGVPAMERVAFQRAIKAARDLKADGIIVESVDRLTRAGVMDFFGTATDLELRHDLKLVVADMPQGMDKVAFEIYASLMAIMAKAFRERLKAQITTGLARAKKEGWKKGRPGMQPKPNLEPHEVAYVREQRALGRRGAGWGRMALEITRRRGAAEVVDVKARQRRTVTMSWLRQEWRRIEAGSIVRDWKTPSPVRPAIIEGLNLQGSVSKENEEPAIFQEIAKGGAA